MTLLRIGVDGLCEHALFMGITYLRNLLGKAIDLSQDPEPSIIITVTKFAIGNFQGVQADSLEKPKELNGLVYL